MDNKDATNADSQENNGIVTFSLGDETHPINENDEIIEYIGERIKSLDGLQKCTNLKV